MSEDVPDNLQPSLAEGELPLGSVLSSGDSSVDQSHLARAVPELTTTQGASFEDLTTTKDWAEAHASDSERSYAARLRRDTNVWPGEAKYQDGLAARLEEWAGVLYDHPPSEAFIKKFGRLEPATLIQFESDIEDNLDQAEKEEKRQQSLRPEDLFDGNFYAHLWTGVERAAGNYKVLSEFGKSSLGEEYRKLVKDGNTTLNEAVVMFRKIMGDLLVEPHRAKARVFQVILDDVRSGRASTYGNSGESTETILDNTYGSVGGPPVEVTDGSTS